MICSKNITLRQNLLKYLIQIHSPNFLTVRIIPSGYENKLSKQEITNIKPIITESRDTF